VALAALAGYWHTQAQMGYQRVLEAARNLELQFKESALEEAPDTVRVRFSLVLVNTGEEEIVVKSVSCLLYAGREFLGPSCQSATETAPSVLPGQEWRLDVTTAITGHYLNNYWEARREGGTEGITVRGTVQLRLPINESEFLEAKRRFNEEIRRP
jgi:hypothetical protein